MTILQSYSEKKIIKRNLTFNFDWICKLIEYKMKERLRLKEKLPMLEFHNRLTTWKFFFVLSIRHFNFVEYFPFQNILCLIFMLSMRVGKLILWQNSALQWIWNNPHFHISTYMYYSNGDNTCTALPEIGLWHLSTIYLSLLPLPPYQMILINQRTNYWPNDLRSFLGLNVIFQFGIGMLSHRWKPRLGQRCEVLFKRYSLWEIFVINKIAQVHFLCLIV